MSSGFKTSGAERPRVFEKCYLEPGESDNASVPRVERVIRKLCDVFLRHCGSLPSNLTSISISILNLQVSNIHLQYPRVNTADHSC